jgi:lipopolysaccharide export system ATP-binding protein
MESVYPDTADIASHPGEFLLRTQGLRKVYDGRAVVNGVDVTVRPGEIVKVPGVGGLEVTVSALVSATPVAR